MARAAVGTVADADRESVRSLAERSWWLEPDSRSDLIDLLLDRPGQRADLRLAARADGAVVGALVADVHDGTGYLDAIAVDPDWQRRGVGTALMTEAEQRLNALGAGTVCIGGHPWYYAWPGVDERYTAALELAARLAYRRSGTAQNMTVALPRPSDAMPPVPAGWILQRAGSDDGPELDQFTRKDFQPSWPHEVAHALDRPVPPVFLARYEGRVAGFACHGVYRPGWFGPTGVAPALRGQKIGHALLELCLADIAANGFDSCDIAWVGPADFYARTVGAQPGRQFALFTKELR